MEISLQAYPVPHEVKSQVTAGLWIMSPNPSQLTKKPNLDTYFDRHYYPNCQLFARDGGTLISTKTQAEVVGLAKRILQGSTKSAALASLAGPGDAKPDANAVNLCARLTTMCDFGGPEFGSSARRCLPWGDHQTIREAVAENFQPEKKLQPDNPRFQRFFTARHMEKIGGMRILWTNNLMDHLLLSEDDRAVFLFHHADFLRFQSGLANPVFPDGLIQETLQTLALLLPQNKRKMRRWVRSQVAEHSLDPSLAWCGRTWSRDRRFEKFEFWHDRLVILKQAFDESSPRRLSQWWADRRNPIQWSTFWVAILVFATTVFFGLVQSIEGGIQVHLALKAT
ncbi:hypothetical protein QBC39DRAFT_356376 [Podospora conica]|nr:hypothetical protein QBC39DRAFT_356376 [Schizothecium conicum]